jgi:hypothetical protein
MDKLLSTDDIIDIIGYPISMKLYDDLKKVRRIDELFDPTTGDACLILVRNGPNVGHWVVLTYDDGVVTFFDSYGGFIDDQLDHTPIRYRPDMSRLLSEYPGHVEYNPFQLQRYAMKVATCGRWCALWVCKRDMPVDSFGEVIESFRRYVDLDQLVTILTDEELANNISRS